VDGIFGHVCNYPVRRDEAAAPPAAGEQQALADGGAAAGNGELEASGALALSGDPVAEAARVTMLVQGSGEPL